MGKSFSFQSALILFWLLFFITVKFCSAHFASSATHQSFPENEGKPENENLGNKGSLNHIEEHKFKSIIKRLFYKKPLLQRPFIQMPPGISHIQRFSSKPSIPTFEEKPPVQMVKRPNFLLIPFLKNLFPIMKNKPHLQRPTLKRIPFVKTPKFLHFPKFIRPIPIIEKPFLGYEKVIPKPFPAMEKPIPKFVSEPIPIVERPSPVFEKPISEPIPAVEKPFPEFEKPVSEPIPAVEKPFPEFEQPVSEPIPAVEKPFPEFEQPVSEPISIVKKPFPEFEEPVSKPTPTVVKSFPKFEEHVSKPIPPMDKQIPSAQKLITSNEKSMPISKKDSLLPQLAHTMDPESLKLKEYLFKKHIPKIPFPPKFENPLPVQKPNPLP